MIEIISDIRETVENDEGESANEVRATAYVLIFTEHYVNIFSRLLLHHRNERN
jgi:hypothetical protein